MSTLLTVVIVLVIIIYTFHSWALHYGALETISVLELIASDVPEVTETVGEKYKISHRGRCQTGEIMCVFPARLVNDLIAVTLTRGRCVSHNEYQFLMNMHRRNLNRRMHPREAVWVELIREQNEIPNTPSFIDMPSGGKCANKDQFVRLMEAEIKHLKWEHQQNYFTLDLAVESILL